MIHILQLMKLHWLCRQQHPSTQHDLSPKQFRNEMVMKQKLYSNAFIPGLSQTQSAESFPELQTFFFVPQMKTKPIFSLFLREQIQLCVISKKYCSQALYFLSLHHPDLLLLTFWACVGDLDLSWPPSSPFPLPKFIFHPVHVPKHCSLPK